MAIPHLRTLCLTFLLSALVTCVTLDMYMPTSRGVSFNRWPHILSGPDPVPQIELFRAHMGRWPEQLNELYTAPGSGDEHRRWQGPYVPDRKSLQDRWGNELGYQQHPDVGYRIWSAGSDERDDTKDDITPYDPHLRVHADDENDWVVPAFTCMLMGSMLWFLRRVDGWSA